MLGSPAGPGAPSQRGLWTSAPIPSATGYSADGFSKYGVYSLFPGGPTFGSALYSHANAFSRFTSGQFQPSPGNIFHASHKVSDSLFSSGGYNFGAPTPPPGSPYSPIPVTQLELLTKGINSNIIIQQATDYSLSPKKLQISEGRCEEKCCNVKQKSCLCQDDSTHAFRGKFSNGSSGCSRTNPIEWGSVNVKKEPGNPCQVAEITTSLSPVIKVEVASPTQRNGGEKEAGIANGNIPVGIAVARQRIQQPELINSPSLPPAGLLTTVNAAGQIKEIARLSEIESTQADMAASMTAGGVAGGTLLQCSDDRNTALTSWPIGAAQGSSLSAPTLWQYPAPVPMESMVPLSVPMPPVGFQLVRDPTSGGFLLLPTTTSLEPIQQAVVWPSYTQQSPLLLPPLPPPPLQLLSSATSDYLSSSATFHQQTQTHSTRLLAVTTDTKRKIPLAPTTLIKIEADASSLDHSKTISSISSNSGAVFSDQNMAPLVTTHVIYQHPPNLILSQPAPVETSCKSQVTSPLPCLTPPPEISSQAEEPPLAVDASNQTETPICSEDDNTLQTLPEVNSEPDHASKYQEEDIQTEIIQTDQIVQVEPMPVEKEMQTELRVNVESETPVVEEKEQSKIEDQNVAEKETAKPDLSGLELLSNSIVEFESCRVVKSEIRSSIDEPISPQIEEEKSNDTEEVTRGIIRHNPSEDNLGGLDLLCALAEQRILEESTEIDESKKAKLSRKEKRKSRRHSDEPRHKKRKSDKNSDEEHRHKIDVGLKKSKWKRSASEGNSCDNEVDIKCKCGSESYKSFKPQTEELMAKLMANKGNTRCCMAEWPCMNAMELDMRMRIADLQRQFKEKQKELKKLGKHRHHSKKRSRKRSSHSDNSDTPPPLLDPEEVPNPTEVKSTILLKPPTLCVAERVESSKLIKSKTEKSGEKDKFTWNVEEPSKSLKRKCSVEGRRDSHDKDKKSASKKRKVGRPRRISEHFIPTETIVAKKPKTGNFIGYLMAAKEKLQMRSSSFSDSPPRFIDDSSVFVEKKNKNNNTIQIEENTKKSDPESYEVESNWETDEDEEGYSDQDTKSSKMEEEEEQMVAKTEVQDEEEQEEKVPHVCTLTPEHLEIENLRVLTAMGGLFYAGMMHAVQPPDVYSITLDGERGNRPHIMSREEILRDAIVEIAPKSTEELQPGTRLCAYWSQQYRCLYPGSVAEPGTPNPEMDSKFVCVEFDDGDNGTIALEDIRFLPSNLPIMEYDPNPLLSLSRRKRRRSSSNTNAAERRQNEKAASLNEDKEVDQTQMKKEDISSEDLHKERKRLKKKKKEKKKRKHRCEEENCTHKKHHKKHKKHRKHHHDKENSSSEKSSVEISSIHPNLAPQEVEDIKPVILQEVLSDAARDVESQLRFDKTEEAEENEDTNLDDASDEKTEDDDDDDYIPSPEDEVTIDDIQEIQQLKIRNRQASCESSKSRMSAFLTEKHIWSWSGKTMKRVRGKGRKIKCYYSAIERGKERISLHDTAVFCSTSKPERPYIGQITSLYEKSGGNKYVKVKWYYHPEETDVNPSLYYAGGVFSSLHYDENDVQTISHKCKVVSLKEYLEILRTNPRLSKESSLYYLAGEYEARDKVLTIYPDVPINNTTK